MKSDYLDWDQMNHFYRKITETSQPEDILLYEKRLKEKEEKRKQTQKNLKIANTISAVDAIATIATINDKTSTLNNQLNILKENVEVLDGRIETLERSAADRCGIFNRPRRKLTIKVSA